MNRKQKTIYKHNRRSIRLPGYDYSQPGAYYITICAHDRRLIFGNIVAAKIDMNPIGGIVAQQWDYDRLNSSAFNGAHTRESCIPCGREVYPL